MANSHRSHESNADEMHPIQTVTKTKMGTLAMHRSKKLYVHASMKNEALLDVKMEWGRMTPSPNEIVGKKVVRNVAAKSGNEFAAICCNGVWKFAALCRLMTPVVAAICRIRGLISS
jgi:hypothetical protein